MFWLDIITLFLIILLLIGVCYIVLEFLKQLIDKKDLETEFEELESQFREYQKNHLDQMDGYQKSYESLSQQFCQYQKKVEKGLENINNDIDEICKYTDRMIQMNQEFFDQIKRISTLLTQKSLSPEEIKTLIDQISDDVKKQIKYEHLQQEEIQERRANIERHRETDHYRGPELER